MNLARAELDADPPDAAQLTLTMQVHNQNSTPLRIVAVDWEIEGTEPLARGRLPADVGVAQNAVTPAQLTTPLSPRLAARILAAPGSGVVVTAMIHFTGGLGMATSASVELSR